MGRFFDEALVNAKLKEICENSATTYGIEYGGRAEKFARLTESIPPADVVDSAVAKALEEDLERAGNELAKVEAERDALLEELQRLADCSSCKFNAPDAVDGCSALMPCKDGSMWEWKGVKP